jgi:hypothetical protein
VSVRTAIDVLLLVVVLIDLALTAGIVRRLRRMPDHAVTERPAPNPRPGYQVDLTKDGEPWPVEAAAMLTGQALVAFVLPGCLGCERLQRDVDAFGALPVPFYLITDPFFDQTGGPEYLATWTGVAGRIVAPKSMDVLDSFERPDEFPTVVLLQDGRVLASGHRLDDVVTPMAQLSEAAAAGRPSAI